MAIDNITITHVNTSNPKPGFFVILLNLSVSDSATIVINQNFKVEIWKGRDIQTKLIEVKNKIIAAIDKYLVENSFFIDNALDNKISALQTALTTKYIG